MMGSLFDISKDCLLCFFELFCNILTFLGHTMPFREERALAFSRYTLPAIMDEQKGKTLVLTRAELAKILDVKNVWDQHIELISREAEKHEIATANLSSRIIFLDLQKKSSLKTMNAKDAKAITDRFEKLFGSKAADGLWESRKYRS